MKNKLIHLLIGAAVLAIVLHRGGWISLTGKVTKRKAVKLAALALIGKPKHSGNVPVTVTHADGKFHAKFQFPVPGGKPGEIYHSFAVVDDSSGEVLELGVDEGKQKQEPARADDSPTPLGEETDAVSELQKHATR